jgi:hypothetical protein
LKNQIGPVLLAELSSMKSSVKRHIQNIHDGNANFVSFVACTKTKKVMPESVQAIFDD